MPYLVPVRILCFSDADWCLQSDGDAGISSLQVPGAGTDGAGPAVIAAVGLAAANTPVSQPAAAAATAAAAAESPTRPLTSGDTAAATTTAAGRELQTDRRLTNVELAERVCIEMYSWLGLVFFLFFFIPFETHGKMLCVTRPSRQPTRRHRRSRSRDLLAQHRREYLKKEEKKKSDPAVAHAII